MRVIAFTDDVHARQAELSERAAALFREGATGELVLVVSGTGEVVARRLLRLPEDEESA
jgi:hypothetical protein